MSNLPAAHHNLIILPCFEMLLIAAAPGNKILQEINTCCICFSTDWSKALKPLPTLLDIKWVLSCHFCIVLFL